MTREYLERLPHEDGCEMQFPPSLRSRSIFTECTCPRAAVIARWDAMERVIATWEAWEDAINRHEDTVAQSAELEDARRALAELDKAQEG